MQTLTSQPRSNQGLSPSDFGALHRERMKQTVDPLAQEAGVKSLGERSSKFDSVVLDNHRGLNPLGVFGDNLSQIRYSGAGSLKWSEIYERDGQEAEASAFQASEKAGGQLDSDTARFLPYSLQPDYELVTGDTISKEPGVAVEGVTVQKEGELYEFGINFEQALAGATARDVVLAVTDTVALVANRIQGGVADSSLPPYQLMISPRYHASNPAFGAQTEYGRSSFYEPATGLLVSNGSSVSLFKDNGDEPFQKLSFHIDQQNDYGEAGTPATSATEKVRTSWDEGAFADGQFDFESGLKSGRLELRSKKEVEAERGAKVLFKAIRENTGSGITKLVKDGLLGFAYDKSTHSIGVLRRNHEILEHSLSIIDLSKGEWVGTWAASDDGTKEWIER